VVDAAGARHGVEAVVDKDRATALLAIGLGAEALVLLTDVDAVYEGWRTPGALPLRRASVDELRTHTFEEGSMGPKVEAACWFVEATGRQAHIGALGDAVAVVHGEAGTTIVR
jgi:carbamate kinase